MSGDLWSLAENLGGALSSSGTLGRECVLREDLRK